MKEGDIITDTTQMQSIIRNDMNNNMAQIGQPRRNR